MIFSRKLRIASVVSVACFLGVANPLHAQTCTQTLSVGANVASAVSSASNGSTICLNSGNYGTVNFSNIARSDYVTVRSTSGVGATIGPRGAAIAHIGVTGFMVLPAYVFVYCQVARPETENLA